MQVANESDPLAKRNLELLESGNFADAEIICKGKVWKVHKLILRSGCVWFDKAFTNNWQEAQTGRIHLEEQQPERIDGLLKFIYSGRHAPKFAKGIELLTNPNLEINVSLWQTADFFLLPVLKFEIQEYLLDRIAGTLHFFHSFRMLPKLESWNSNAMLKNDLSTFFADFSGAVKTAQKCPPAREIHKLLAILACGLREYLPGYILWGLMHTPGFQKDMPTALILIHFEQATMPSVAVDLKDSFSVAAKQGQCHFCGQNFLKKAVLDPFSSGLRKWCDRCAILSIKTQLKTMIKEWPAEADQTDWQDDM